MFTSTPNTAFFASSVAPATRVRTETPDTPDAFDALLAYDETADPAGLLRLEADTTLYTEGRAGDTVYAVRGGMLKLQRRLPSGAQRIVRVLREGDVLGLELLIDGVYRHTAVSLVRCSLQAVDKADLQARMQTQMPATTPAASSRTMLLMQHWQDMVDEADLVIAQLSTGTARGRVARLLLHLTRRSSEGTCPSLTREDMGALLGLTTETASRVIAAFKRDGAVQESRGQLRCDAQALQRYAQE